MCFEMEQVIQRLTDNRVGKISKGHLIEPYIRYSKRFFVKKIEKINSNNNLKNDSWDKLNFLNHLFSPFLHS